MKALADAGFKQGVFAPHARTRFWAAGGSSALKRAVMRKLAAAAQHAPALLAACSSASSMWTANAATVSPSADTADGRVHFTPANFNNKFHRSIEHPVTGRLLQAMFPDARHFAHHAALPAQRYLAMKVANHTRLGADYVGKQGSRCLVAGNRPLIAAALIGGCFPARQTLEACQATSARTGRKTGGVCAAITGDD